MTLRVGDRVQVASSGAPERCTRERGHGLPHVHHMQPGAPLIAWRPESTGSEPVGGNE